ncbi:pentapeptide repeat-containing protein [Micromonospora krabiensis]|uniref:pentapeptide repeat-containing protein n=1 Tax=Micromonospora krabiensis TaxID=307121 RepID=UPI0012FDEE75|nr:pentapeptide repeat-containing protein [Micromonospora krabiensis]
MALRLSKVLSGLSAALLLTAAGLAIPSESWAAISAGIVEVWVAYLLAILGAASAIAGIALRRKSERPKSLSAAPAPPERQLQLIPSWTIPAGVLLVATATASTILWLQADIPSGGTDIQQAQLRATAIRTGLSVGAGVAGALALLVALRRQQLAERTQQAAEYDAVEKRVTELYVKAAEQLGSDKAPVRLAGLYALERLAQDNPIHRTSITEVICAYLRMPYKVNEVPREPDPDYAENPGLEPDEDDSSEDSTGERQVRLAAQRILARHLRPSTSGGLASPSYWGPLRIDLSGAALVNLDLSKCVISEADFSNAIFYGKAIFAEVAFAGDATFLEATFRSSALFDDADFAQWASFGGTKILGEARFGGVRFKGGTWFGGTQFSKKAAWFDDTVFMESASFRGQIFPGRAIFDRADFKDGVDFDSTEFNESAWFEESIFRLSANFRHAVFSEPPSLEGALAPPSDERGDDVWPDGWQRDMKTTMLIRSPG